MMDRQEKILVFGLMAVMISATLFVVSRPRNLFNDPTSFVIEDRAGELLGAAIADDGQWRFPATDQVPPKFIECITTFEDRNFFIHHGVDYLAILRAAYQNILHGRKAQGGSTITMELLRLSRPNARRNISSKIRESVGALQLESEKSKQEILSLYAANAPFGGNVVGLEAAAWRYYGRAAKDLSWGEMSALAVLPNAPSVVHPGKNRSELLRKRNFLLQQLQARGRIDSSTARLAMLEPLPGAPLPLPRSAPHLLQRFKQNFNKHQLTKTIARTTINGNWQAEVNSILSKRHGPLYANGIKNAAALVLDVESGEVLVYAGNVNAEEEHVGSDLQADVDIVKAPRSPGSTLKPILYAAALSEGRILPHSLLPDVPTRIGGYTPQNFDRKYDGAVPASEAISRSLNIPAVKLLQNYKYGRFYELLKQLGMTTLDFPADHYGLSMILGGSEVTLWDMASIYAGMAKTVNHATQNHGLVFERDFAAPHFILSEKREKETTRKINGLDGTSIWYAFEAMKEVMRPGEEGLWQQFLSSQKISWKTGTSFGFRDGWAIGVTKKFVVAVWVGNANGEGRAGLTGVQTAAPIMFDIFRMLPPVGQFESPYTHFDFLPVCRKSGFKAGPDCDVVDTVMAPAKGIHAPQCKYHVTVHLDKTETWQVSELCESPSEMVHKSWFVLSPAMEWYYKQKHHDYKPLPPFKPGCIDGGGELELIYPLQNAKIYIPLEIDGSRGKVIFKAVNRNTSGKVFWHIDERYMGSTTNFHQLAVDIEPGTHELTLVTEKGESIKRIFNIVGEEK